MAEMDKLNHELKDNLQRKDKELHAAKNEISRLKKQLSSNSANGNDQMYLNQRRTNKAQRGGDRKATKKVQREWNFDTDTSNVAHHSDFYGDKRDEDRSQYSTSPQHERDYQGYNNGGPRRNNGGPRTAKNRSGSPHRQSQHDHFQQQNFSQAEMRQSGGTAAWEDAPIVKGNANAQIEAESENVARQQKAECPTCGRTFNVGVGFDKHRGYVLYVF